MTIATGSNVSIEYTLTVDGNEVDSNVGGDPLEYCHGESQIIPGLEQALEGMAVDETKNVTVQPEEGYGPVDSEAVLEVKKEQVPEEAHEIGAQLMTKDPQGNLLRPVVKEVKDETIVLDFNHPLAGKVLTFDVKVLAIN